MLDAFNNLDSAIQGQIIGGVTALLSVLLTSLGAIALAVAQLRHQKKQKEREQTFELKRDIYLDALELYGKTLPRLIAGIATLNFNNDPNETATYIKLGIVANKDTQKHLAAFQEKLTSLLIKFATEFSTPAKELEANMRQIELQLDASSQRSGQALSEMENLTMTAMYNARQFNKAHYDYLSRQFDEAQRTGFTANNEWSSMQIQLVRMRIGFFKTLIESYKEIVPYFRELVLSIRKDLGIRVSKKELSNWTTDDFEYNAIEQLISHYEEYIDKLERASNE